MAYQTGSAANLTELLDALRLFAIAQGWTVDKWTSASQLLFLRKGNCNVAMQSATQSLTHFPNGVSTAYTDTVLRMALSTSITASLTTYFGHPGSLSTTATDTDRVEVNNLVGPFNAYHFFSGNETAGDPAYIYIVLQVASDRYQHFGFGNIDKKGMTHSGGAFLGGFARYWYRSQLDLFNIGSVFNDPPSHGLPYSGVFGRTPVNAATENVYLPDALPLTWTGTQFTNWNSASAATPVPIPLATIWQRPANYAGAADAPKLLSNLIAAPTSQWSGNLHLWPSPIIMGNGSQICYVGDHPNIRYCNMEGLGATQEITYGTETWMVFPNLTQRVWGQDRLAGFDGVSSGQYGVAYKKIA